MPAITDISGFSEYLKNFSDADNPESETEMSSVSGSCHVKTFKNSFWTPKQRQASSIHEVSYRACFKPQLPRFFIELLTEPGDCVYDPFTGRGTTIIEAGLLGRKVISNDINPLSRILCEPRLLIPGIEEIEKRLLDIESGRDEIPDFCLPMFYHPKTESEIVNLKNYLQKRRTEGKEDYIDRWIRMAATNRLTGHSPGFFSVYTLPPNQAVSKESQIKINEKRGQIPEYRDTSVLILKKSRQLLKNIGKKEMESLHDAGKSAVFLNCDAGKTPEIPSESVVLTVTSPPFLNIVQYAKDNWLRCWFNSLDEKEIAENITMSATLSSWCSAMEAVFGELYRITKPGGWVAFEVGEVRNGRINLDEHVVPLGTAQGFECAGILLNEQNFTKTSNIWGISNKKRGTNTNRVVIFQKSE